MAIAAAAAACYNDDDDDDDDDEIVAWEPPSLVSNDVRPLAVITTND